MPEVHMKSKTKPNSKALRIAGISCSLGLISLHSSLCQAPVVPKTAIPPTPASPQIEGFLPASAVLQKWRTLPVVYVSINSSLLERVILDTGLNKNLVLPDASARLNLSLTKETVKAVFLDSACEAPGAVIERMRFSNFPILNTPVALANVPSFLSAKPHPDAPAGWLGTQFLSKYQVTFDFIRNVVTLSKPDAPFPKGGDTTIVPFIMVDDRPFVKVSLPGSKPFLALLDTGSPGTLLPAEETEKLKLKPLRVDVVTQNSGKQGKAALLLIPKMSVGKLEWKGARAIYLTSESAPEFDRKLSAVGMDFLSRYRVTINYVRKQIQFASPIVEEKQP